MLVITVKWEAEKGDKVPHQPSLVHVRLMNEQVALQADASLRSGEAVEHRLRLDHSGTMTLTIRG